MIGLGLAVAAGRAPAVASSGSNPNLLTWTEQFQNAAWVKSNTTVTSDAGTDPLTTSTADQIEFTSIAGTITQTSTTAAASGGATATSTPTSTWQRFSATATFDTGDYTFSVWLKDPGNNGFSVQLVMNVSGGNIFVRLRDLGDQAVFLAWGAKLEVGASPTGDETNYGSRTT